MILAAGRGTRLGLNGTPKCLLEAGGETLIERQLRTLEALGVTAVCVVVGYRKAQVLSIVESRSDVVVNDRYTETNSLYSLWLARNWVSGPFVLVNGDVIADPEVYRKVLAVDGSALAYDGSSGNDDEHMKVALDGNHVRALSKTLRYRDTDGENVGILRFDDLAAPSLFAETEELIAAGGANDWAPAAVNSLVKTLPILGVDVAGLPWIEVDFPEDLDKATRTVVPLIDGLSPSQRGPSIRSPQATVAGRRLVERHRVRASD